MMLAIHVGVYLLEIEAQAPTAESASVPSPTNFLGRGILQTSYNTAIYLMSQPRQASQQAPPISFHLLSLSLALQQGQCSFHPMTAITWHGAAPSQGYMDSPSRSSFVEPMGMAIFDKHPRRIASED